MGLVDKNLSMRRQDDAPLRRHLTRFNIFYYCLSGSYGWIDADGFLRLRDYIADDQGYRILKSKTVFVGHNRPIEVRNTLIV